MAIKYNRGGVNLTPLDFDEIQKGDVISPAQLEEITGRKIGTTKYQLAVLQLSSRIAKECADRNKPVSIAVMKGTLCVLTDEQASEYEHQQFKSRFRGAGRAHRRAVAVNVGRLSDVQKKKHERNVFVQAGMLQAARTQRRRLIAQAHKRTVPGLPASGTEGANANGDGETVKE